MVAGHLREQNGLYQIILSYKDGDGKRKTKSISTGLPVKGNKRKAEAMLMDARQTFVPPVFAVAPLEKAKPDELLFTDFILEWLEMMKNSVETTTYASYCMVIKRKIVPYFKDKRILLKDLTPKDIQDYYQYSLNTEKVTANTVIHRHANIRKSLQYAVKIGLINYNPADRVERPRKQKYIASFYNEQELETLFAAVKGKPIELAVILGAFYGLRRSEAVGLRWDAIDYERKTLTIKHTVTQMNVDGKQTIVDKERTKTKSSYRTLPLVAPFEKLLHELKAEQEEHRKVCGSAYCTEFLDYIYVNEIGERIKVAREFGDISENSEYDDAKNEQGMMEAHGCAVLCTNGVSLKDIREWLGHSDISRNLNIYTIWITVPRCPLQTRLLTVFQQKMPRTCTVRGDVMPGGSRTHECLPQRILESASSTISTHRQLFSELLPPIKQSRKLRDVQEDARENEKIQYSNILIFKGKRLSGYRRSEVTFESTTRPTNSITPALPGYYTIPHGKIQARIAKISLPGPAYAR